MAGLTTDAVKSGERQQSVYETQFILPKQTDSITEQAGGKVFRRTESTLLSDEWFGDDSNLYLDPYDYDPGVPAPKN